MNRAAFTHRVRRMDNELFFAPGTKAWNQVWPLAKKQDWYEDGIKCVGNHKGRFYFQIDGLDTGFAELTIS